MNLPRRFARNSVIRAAALLITVVAGGLTGLDRADAQSGLAATPTGQPSCTADLGIVRSTKTCVNVVHVSQDAPWVDVDIDGQEIVTGLGYAAASGFLNVPAGTVDVRIETSGAGSHPLEVTLANVELVAGHAYEIAIVGPLGERAVFVYDVNTYAVEDTASVGSSRVRLINAATDIAAANLDLIGDDIATRSFSGVNLRHASDYAVIPAGTYRLQLSEAAGSEEVPYFPEFTGRFAPGSVTSLYVIGARSSDTLTIFPVTTQASRLVAPTLPSSPAA